MSSADAGTWHPRPEHLNGSCVAELARKLGVADFDALYKFSIERPADYWRTVNAYCGIVWSMDYGAYSDLSGGKEFPKWFVGGELNWTDTVFSWGKDEAGAARTAIIAEREDGHTAGVTYAELEEQVRAFAAGLENLGVRRGDRLGLLMEPGIEAVVSLLALSHMGAIVVPLFSGFGVDAVVSRLSLSGARGLIATTGFRRRGNNVDVAPVAIEVRDRLSALDLLILKGSDGETPPTNAVDWHDVAARPAPGRKATRMGANDPFMVIYTSGTTGRPKGPVHTHGGFPLKIAHDSAVHFDVRPGDVYFWPADMGWVAGPLIIASALMRGATMVCYDGAPDFPDWSRMSRLIEKHKVTHFGSAPTMIRGFAANAAASVQGDISSIRLLITAGENIDPEHFAWHQRTFGRGACPMINYTGGTEVSGALLASVVVKPIVPAGFNSASPAVNVDVVDANGTPLVDAVGELAILEPFVGMTQSFWQDDTRYLETYWGNVPGKWIHGDLALRTSRGDFFMRGRSDDTLKIAGKRLGPAEVEEVLLELPSVSEAAAIGVDDAAKGQSLVVFVIPSSAGRTQDDLPSIVARQIETRVGKPFRPSRVHVVDQLPKTRSSKVMRRVIRSVYCGLPAGDLSSLDNPSAIAAIEQAANR